MARRAALARRLPRQSLSAMLISQLQVYARAVACKGPTWSTYLVTEQAKGLSALSHVTCKCCLVH